MQPKTVCCSATTRIGRSQTPENMIQYKARSTHIPYLGRRGSWRLGAMDQREAAAARRYGGEEPPRPSSSRGSGSCQYTLCKAWRRRKCPPHRESSRSCSRWGCRPISCRVPTTQTSDPPRARNPPGPTWPGPCPQPRRLAAARALGHSSSFSWRRSATGMSSCWAPGCPESATLWSTPFLRVPRHSTAPTTTHVHIPPAARRPPSETGPPSPTNYGEIRRLLTHRPVVEFEKTSSSSRNLSGKSPIVLDKFTETPYLKLMNKTRKISTCKRLDLESTHLWRRVREDALRDRLPQVLV